MTFFFSSQLSLNTPKSFNLFTIHVQKVTFLKSLLYTSGKELCWKTSNVEEVEGGDEFKKISTAKNFIRYQI